MRLIDTPIAAALLALLLPLTLDAAETGSDNMVDVALVSEVDTIVPGEPFWVGLQQQITPGWHTYWRNPGDSGAPTTLAFDLPDGFTAGEIQWPIPHRIPYGQLMNFGYKDEVLLTVLITPPATLPSDDITLKAAAEWLVCEDICIPEDAELALTLPVGDSAGPSPEAPEFEAVRARIPDHIGVGATQSGEGETIRLSIEMPGLVAARIRDVSFFPFGEGMIDNPVPQEIDLTPDGIEITLAPGYDFSPGTPMDGIVVIEEDSGESLVSAFEIRPAVTAGAMAPPRATGVSLGTALVFAFLGGLILNLMPCVFPVLSIKILSLMGQVGSHSTKIRQHGWAYLAGVVLSFVAVAVVLIALRAGGAEIGWGFQLQSPIVVAMLAYLFFVIGLNLFGYFELGTSVMSLGQSATEREGLSGSFFTGVLATVVAAPCTVPFMATAVGFALTQTNAIALLTFAALGLGMAAPYVALCYSPALMDRLPRPGAWMARFKELLAFPMFATAVWLTWVLSQQAGSGGVVTVGSGMLLIAFALWLAKYLPRPVGTVAAAVFVIAALYFPTLLRSVPAAIAGAETAAVQPAPSYVGPAWSAWSPEVERELRQQGPVFVNFTAAWCITCKVNEAVALDSEAVRDAFENRSIAYLKGDWTNEDPAITRALQAYERSGVPLYLLYTPGQERARVLPQVLTESIVLGALEEL